MSGLDPTFTDLPHRVLGDAALARAHEYATTWLASLDTRPVPPQATVADIAATGAVSRSGLDARFRGYLGRSPILYLTEWRMHVARDLLRSTDLGVQTVARRVGYDAEAAFSRAFKRESGAAPAHWRAAQCAHEPHPAR